MGTTTEKLNYMLETKEAIKTALVGKGASVDDANKLYDFGVSMGLAFQLQDDWLDVYGDPEVFGKNIGGDILCNKKTYMLITALNLANERQHAELQKWISTADADPAEKIAAVTHIYNEMEIGKQCMDKADAYYAEGLAILESIALPAERKEGLKQFACSLMNRKV